MGQFVVYARNDQQRSIGRAQSPRWCMGLYRLAEIVGVAVVLTLRVRRAIL